MVSKRAIGQQLGTPTTMKGTLELAAALGAGMVGVKYMQLKKCEETKQACIHLFGFF